MIKNLITLLQNIDKNSIEQIINILEQCQKDDAKTEG